jgi:hypothetical protein
MAFRTQKISQMTPKGANLEGTDLLEVSTLESGSYVTRSITGQEIIDAASGTGVTNITVNAPLATTGGTTPDLSISEADGTTDGFITAVDWSTFNSKQAALVSGTNIKTIEGQSLLGSGNIDLTKSDVGLGNVDNTSDANKPISTATQTALNAKQNTLTLTTTGTSGAATLVGDTLNIPQYSGGGGASGIHALLIPTTGFVVSNNLTSTGMGSTIQVTNRLMSSPFIPAKTFTSSSLTFRVFTAVASALSKIMIYSDVNGYPTTLLYESANIDCSTTGTKTISTSFTFTAGTIYWLTFWTNSTPTIFTIASTNMYAIRTQGAVPSPANLVSVNLTYGSAPTTLSGTTEASQSMPFIGITQS